MQAFYVFDYFLVCTTKGTTNTIFACKYLAHVSDGLQALKGMTMYTLLTSTVFTTCH